MGDGAPSLVDFLKAAGPLPIRLKALAEVEPFRPLLPVGYSAGVAPAEPGWRSGCTRTNCGGGFRQLLCEIVSLGGRGSSETAAAAPGRHPSIVLQASDFLRAEAFRRARSQSGKALFLGTAHGPEKRIRP
jgi:hypothetical protein